MTEKRIIDLSEEPARLRARGDLLVISPHPPSPPPSGEENPSSPRASAPLAVNFLKNQSEVTVPFENVAVIVVSNPAVTFTQAVLAGLARAGASFVACDEKRVPVAMMLPLDAHFAQTERFAHQAQAALPTRKRLWRQIVKAKVRAQARVLEEIRDGDHGLYALAEKVRSGDPENIEAQASRRYWLALFDDPQFRRSRDGGPPNPLLNYGYAVLRAIVARAVCASGLHPSLGVHHHNRYDTFCLASDLMEPFRPIVDRAVALYCREFGTQTSLDKHAKAEILNALMGRFNVKGESRALFDVVEKTASSLAAVYASEREKLVLPEI